MEVPRPGRGHIGAAAASLHHSHIAVMPDPSHICELHHSSRQRQILNPRSEARDQTPILMDIGGFVNH